MFRRNLLALTIITVALSANSALAEKFGSSISSDYKTQNNFKISSSQTVSKAPSGISMPGSTQSIETVALPTQTDLINQASTSTQPIYQPQVKTHTSVSDLKQPKITVPSYEKQYNEMFNKQQQQAKKKLTFAESIMNEVNRYGMLIILILVLLIILYAVHKDKPAQTPHLAQKEETRKKNIWEEDF